MLRGLALCVTATALTVLPEVAEAAGFQVYFEQSAAAMGQAAAVVARPGGPSAVFYNPAAIATLDGNQLETNLCELLPATTYISSEAETDGQRTEMSDDAHLLPSLYFTRRVARGITVGLGLNAPFGTGTEWSPTWEGRYYADRTDLACGYVSPVIALEVRPGLSVGAGPIFTRGEATIERPINAPLVFAMAAPELAEAFAGGAFTAANDIQAHLSGEDWGFGARVGIHWQCQSWLSLGVCYQSKVGLDLSGDVTYESPDYEDGDFGGAPGSGAVAEQLGAALFPESGISAELTLPPTVCIGAACSPKEGIALEVDLLWTGWSTYDELAVRYEHLAGQEDVTSAVPKDWEDVVAVRVGAEVALTRRLVGRVGYAFDQSPAPDDTRDPSLPCSDRQNFAAGLTYRFGGWALDAAYVYVVARDGESQLQTATNGDLVGGYESASHALALGARVQF